MEFQRLSEEFSTIKSAIGGFVEPSLSMLPTQCLLKISKYLELIDSMNLADTCKQMRDIVNMIYQLDYQKYVLCYGKNVNTARIMSHIGPHILSLDVLDHLIEPDARKAIVEHAKQLKKLTIKRESSPIGLFILFLDAMATSGRIEELDLAVYFDHSIFTVLESFDKLQKMSLHNYGYYDIFESPRVWSPNLTSVVLSNMRISSNDILSMISQLKYLTHVNIKHCWVVSWRNESLDNITKQVLTAIQENSEEEMHTTLEMIPPQDNVWANVKTKLQVIS